MFEVKIFYQPDKQNIKIKQNCLLRINMESSGYHFNSEQHYF